MRRRHIAALRVLSLLAGAFVACFPARAQLVHRLQIDSTPEGATVFLLQADKETEIGATPFDYQAEFHSDVSILRFTAKKLGYDTKPAEVSAKDTRLHFSLSPRSFGIAPAEISEADLRALQETLNPAIQKIALESLRNQNPFQFDLASGIRLRKIGNDAYLVVPVALSGGPQQLGRIDRASSVSFLATLWGQLGEALAVPLARINAKALYGVVLDADYSHMQTGFSVGVKQELYTTTTLECQPGFTNKMVMDACASRNLNTGECSSGLVLKSVYDPCAQRVPVIQSHTRLVADPKTTIQATRMKALFVSSVRALMRGTSAKQLDENVEAVLTDTDGNVLARHGNVPDAMAGW